MVRFVIGRSKSGKTEYVRRLLADRAKSGNRKLLMIVPDQQSFDTEKCFLELLGPSLSRSVTVLGFSRLCDYIFEKTEYNRAVFADETTKVLLMSVALEECADSMRVYKEKWDHPQLVSMMLSLRQELRRNNVTPDIINELITGDSSLLKDKLYDISLVLSAFDALIKNSFSDAEDELRTACDLLCSNRIFEGYTVCIDSYLSFTEPELMVIEELIRESEDTFVTLSDDGMNDDDSIFSISRDTRRRLTAIAKNNSVSVAEPILCTYDGYFKSDDIRHIEENIFRSDACKIDAQADRVSSVAVFEARNIYDEADLVACNIRGLIMEEGARYSDIAVVMRGNSGYNGVLDLTFDRFDISYFMDAPRNVMSSPLMKLVCAVFDTIHSSFDKDAVLSLVKSGLISVDSIDVALFENYIFTWSLSGKRLLSEFTQNPRGFVDRCEDSDLVTLSKIEKTRKAVIEPMLRFREEIRGATASDLCRSLYELLVDLGVRERINELCDELDQRGEYRLSEEQIKLWTVFTETLDRTAEAVGDRVFSSRRFIDLIKLEFSHLEIAFIPRVIDQVTVGDIERLRLYNKKYVFVIGAVEGEFPISPSQSGLLTLSERNALSDLGLLSDTSTESHILREKYLCYYALTSASDKLFISYPASTLKAEVISPSVMLTDTASILNIPVISSDDVTKSGIDRVWAKKPAYRFFCSRVGSTDILTSALEDYFADRKEYVSSLEALNRAKSREPFVMRESDSPELLYGREMYLSASQVERYHLCRFMYFLEYGLRIKERRKAQIDAMEYGSFVHFILENFIKKYDKETACALSDSDIRHEVDRIISEYAENHFGVLEEQSPRFKYLYRRVGNSAVQLVRHILDELSQSEFVPTAFELSIGEDVPAYMLELANGLKVTIRGKIDRVDIMEKNGRNYIRVVDYKTGTKVFDLSDVMYGLNLQMLLYLSVLCRSDNEVCGKLGVPAGVLYMPAITPVVNAAFDSSSDSIASERNKGLKMNGLLLDDIDVLKSMEKGLCGIYIPVSQGKTDLKGTDNLASLEEFGAIFSKIDHIIAEMATELHRGSAEALPATDRYNACEYCPYISICGHRTEDPVRRILKKDKELILNELGLNTEEAEYEQKLD